MSVIAAIKATKSEKFYGLTPYNSMGGNPVSMVDPDGDAIFAAIAIGAFVNFAVQGFSGNINSTGDAFLAMGIGGVAGALGATSAGLSTSLGVSGILPGAAYGAGAGAVTGGVYGGLNSFLNDDMSFGQGVGIGAVSGGISGGVLGGILGGVNASKAGHNIWTGGSSPGSDIYSEIGRGTQAISNELGYSAENAKSIFKGAYGDIPSYILDIKTKALPTVFLERGYYFDPGYNLRNAGGKILNKLGLTEPSGFWLPGGRKMSTIYLFRPAFSSKNRLISTLGHELYHSNLLFEGIIGPYRHHAAINIWQRMASSKNNLNISHFPWEDDITRHLQVRDLMHMPRYKF